MATATKSHESIAPQVAAAQSARTSHASPTSGLPASTPQQAAGNLAVQRLFRSGAIQAKLAISQPNDPDEQEADRIADQVMRMPELAVQRKCAACAAGAPCPKCGEEKIQRKAASGHSQEASAGVSSQIASLRGGGQPLPSSTRAFFEPRFGQDFSGVRVHTDSRGQESARAIQARAFTAGQDVVFGAGQFAPESGEGKRLLAHELTHVVQRASGVGCAGNQSFAPGEYPPVTQAGDALILRREPDDANKQPEKAKPPPVNNTDLIYRGIVIRGNPERTKYDLKRIYGAGGPDAIIDFVNEAKAFYAVRHGRAPQRPFGTPRTAYDAHVELQATGELEMLAHGVLLEIHTYVVNFREQSMGIALQTLDANEKLGYDELAHYGITTVKTKVKISDCLAGDCEYEKRDHSMAKGSVGAAELQEVAKILLARRKDIDDTRVRRDKYKHTSCGHGLEKDCYDTYDPPYAGLDKELEGKVAEYNKFRDVLADKYPIIEQSADLNSSSSNLDKLATKGPGSEMAELVGDQVAEKIAKIEKSRAGLKGDKVNIWRLPRVIGLTRVAMQVDAEPWKKRAIDDAVEKNKPGIWQSIALAVLNIAALLLAGPTGGISLAVMAGVNVVVAAHSIKEYLIQDALANSSVRAAQALSADQPSLFWLALEIVGAVVDVGAAAAALSKSRQAFKTLAPLVDAAKFADEGKDAEEAIRKVVKAAEELRGANTARKIEAQIQAARKAAGKAELMAAGATKKEIESLEKLAVAGDRTVLNETKLRDLSTMSPEQVQRELGLVKKGTRVTPDEGYVEAFRLDNGHTWQRTADGKWCRFSKGLCAIFGERGGYHIETPPTTHMPATNGSWESARGNSQWLSDNPAVNAITNYQGIPYKNGFPNFSRWSQANVGIQQTTDRAADFRAADRLLAAERGWLHNGQPNAAAAARFRDANGLTWHHHENGRTMQLIAQDLHNNVPHAGGVSGL